MIFWRFLNALGANALDRYLSSCIVVPFGTSNFVLAELALELHLTPSG